MGDYLTVPALAVTVGLFLPLAVILPALAIAAPRRRTT
jgi:hypothetical protein